MTKVELEVKIKELEGVIEVLNTKIKTMILAPSTKLQGIRKIGYKWVKNGVTYDTIEDAKNENTKRY